MSFQNSEENPIEFYLLEVASLIAVREGKEKRVANLIILETLSEWIFMYESGLSVKAAYNKFKGSV
ncbi:hypothetical protein D3C81_1779370 [compost metagenome]